jgi:hypothetical protein
MVELGWEKNPIIMERSRKSVTVEEEIYDLFYTLFCRCMSVINID